MPAWAIRRSGRGWSSRCWRCCRPARRCTSSSRSAGRRPQSRPIARASRAADAGLECGSRAAPATSRRGPSLSTEDRFVSIRLLALLVALGISTVAIGQGKPRIEKAADLPRFTYKIDGSVEDVIRDDAKFRRFTADVRRDAESVLNGYQIDDRATLRQLEGELTQLDFLEGNYDSARQTRSARQGAAGQACRQADVGAAAARDDRRAAQVRRAHVGCIPRRDRAADRCRPRADAVRRRAERGEGSEGRRGDRQRGADPRLRAHRHPADRRQGRRAQLRSRAGARQREVPADGVVAAEGDADRHVHALSRRAQGRQAGHLGGAQRRPRAGQAALDGERRRVG